MIFSFEYLHKTSLCIWWSLRISIISKYIAGHTVLEML